MAHPLCWEKCGFKRGFKPMPLTFWVSILTTRPPMLIFKEQIHYLGHLVSGTSILLLANKIEACMTSRMLDIFMDLQVVTRNSYAIMWTLHIP